MKNLKVLMIVSLVVLTGAILAGCASSQLSHLEGDTVTGPAQVRQGQNINPREITVWGIYKDGSRKVVSVSASNIYFNKSTPGPQLVRVRVGIITTQEVSFMTEVMALRSINVSSPPRTVIYKQGDEPDPKWPGLEIRGEWDRMGSHPIDIASCEVTGFIKEQAGRQTIRVAYEGLAATFNIDIRAMTSIQITQNPAKLDYLQGELLDITGLRAEGVWDGFPREPLEIDESNITGFNGNNVGIQRLTVTKNGRSANFSVEVMGLTSIVIDKPPTKTSYTVGEDLDLTGILVNANYTGADPTKRRTVLIPVDQLTVDGYDPNRIGDQQRITVSIRGQTANFFVNISNVRSSGGGSRGR